MKPLFCAFAAATLALVFSGCHDDDYYDRHSHHGSVYHGRSYSRSGVYYRDHDSYYDRGPYYSRRPYYGRSYYGGSYYSRPYRPAGASIHIY